MKMTYFIFVRSKGIILYNSVYLVYPFFLSKLYK